MQEIPYGETMTYQEISEKIGRPRAVRAVGTAIGKNPLLMVIPCHRVIGKEGTINRLPWWFSNETSIINI